ncbi:MAG: putative MAPEG superfamily protein [Myxococcota bacterium]|jgi:uncharacterized MAPEG superfamily protein
MTVALWCVLVAVFLPYILIGIAKSDPEYIKGDHNKTPRTYEASLTGHRQRAYWAHLNTLEAFPPFAAAVLVAHYTGAEQSSVDMFAGAFILCRVLYGLLYIVNQDKLRSLAWAGGVGCVIGLFVVSA